MPNALQRLVQRMAGVKTPVETKAPSGTFLPLNDMAGFSGKEPAVPHSAQFVQEYRSWVYTCVTTIADEVGKLKLKLYRRKPNGEIEEVKQHPAIDLLYRVNTNLTHYELWQLTSTYADIYGEAFWWLIRDGKKIVGIYPWILPGNLDILTDEIGQITGYRYRVPGKQDTIDFTKEEILHFKNVNPGNPYRGLSPIQAAAFAIATDREAAAWNWRWFKNNAKPGGFIVFPGTLTDEQRERIKTQWDNNHKGTDNAFRYALLEGGVEFKEAGLSQRDMDFLESRNYNRDEIFTIYKVPRALINPDASITRANAEVVNMYFFERTIEPRIMRIVSVLNEFLLPNFDNTGSLFFDYENSSPRNLEADLKYYTDGLNNGWLTDNEIRRMEGLDEYEGGDKFRAPFNLIEVGTEPAKKQAAGVNITKLHTLGKPSIAESLYQESLAIAKQTIGAKHKVATAKTKQVANQQAAITATKTDPKIRQQIGEGLVQMKRARINEEMKVYEQTSRKEFNRQRDDVLKSVGTKAVKAETKAIDFDFDEDEEAELFAKIFLPITRAVVKAHGEDALKLLGSSGFDVNRGVQEFIKRKGLQFCKDINVTTKTNIQTAINEGLEAGEGIESIRARINGVFDEATTYRARMIAQTEVNRASNFGIEEGYAQSEVVDAKEWYTPLDEDDEVCVPMNGTEVKLGESFTLSTGEDVDAPPAHPNCHCTVLPVLGKSKSAEATKLVQPFIPVIINVPVVDPAATAKVEEVAKQGEQAVEKLTKLHDSLTEEVNEADRAEQIRDIEKTE